MTTPIEFAEHNADRFRTELYDLLRIKSISTDTEYAPDCQKAAEWLASHFQTIGLEAEVIPTSRHPLVYAEWTGADADATTVLVYGHYDVQPASREEGWDSDPFEPVERDGKIYARGSTDDKGQVFAHIKAVESILRTEGKLPVNVKFLIEGEEESGSENITKFVAEHADKLLADVCVISDTSMSSKDKPVIVYALRGIVAFELHVYGPAQDLHSGMYGGSIHNPAQALAELIAALHAEDGKVAIPGFYDDVREITAQEREAIAKSPYDNVQLAEDTGATLPWGESDYSIRERIGARPTLEINGMASGYWGNGLKAIIPAHAWAKITCRLVADQKPDRIAELFKKYIADITPPTVRTELKILASGTTATQVDIEAPAIQAAIRAYVRGWGAEPLFRREGGSIPIVSDFQTKLGLPVVMMGYGLNSDNLHGPNEHFHTDMFHKGIKTSIAFLQEVARVSS